MQGIFKSELQTLGDQIPVSVCSYARKNVHLGDMAKWLFYVPPCPFSTSHQPVTHTRNNAGNDDGHWACKSFEDVVSIFDYDGNYEAAKAVEGDQVPHEHVVAKEETLFVNLKRKLKKLCSFSGKWQKLKHAQADLEKP